MTGGLPSDVHQLQPPFDKDLSNTGFVHRPDGGVPFLIIPSGGGPEGGVPFIIIPDGGVLFLITPFGGGPEGGAPFIIMPEGSVPFGAAD